MKIQEFAKHLAELLDFCSFYYTIQLIRCAFISFLVLAFVFLLRNTMLKNKIFLKGALWSLFLPVLFAGKMKFFYESMAGSFLFSGWTGFLSEHRWLNWLYLYGIALYALWLIRKKRKLLALIKGMKKQQIDGKTVYVTELPVTPFAIGIFRPKIIVPQKILEQFGKEELHIILLHEKEHIRSGHLVFYLLWDIVRVLLWINPLLTICTNIFREDIEEICDWITIQKSGAGAFEYGQLLLKTMRLLQTECKDFNMYATFAGDKEYRRIRQRVRKIAGYIPYKQIAADGVFAATFFLILVILTGLRLISYGAYNENDSMLVYGFDGNGVTFLDTGNSNALHQMISYDDSYVYVDREAFEAYLREHGAGKDVYIVFGGFYKLPGIGGYGYSCYYEADAGEQITKIPYDNQDSDWWVSLVKRL